MRVPVSLVCLALLGACSKTADEPSATAGVGTPVAATFVGSDSCSDCHAGQFAAWSGSHHDLAMQRATGDTVLGDFSGAEFEQHGNRLHFLQRDDGFFVVTTAESGTSEEFRVAYTFGVEPLQQYLLEFPGGRLQALTVAWDSRPSEQGGQRWFHLYPEERITQSDPLHWSRRQQNWNYMCAECHSTNLVKNYNVSSDSFATDWSAIDVGCEACHGPASKHVEHAREATLPRDSGLDVDLDDSGYAVWEMDIERGIAARSEPRMRPPVQPEACGRCHSRRAIVAQDYQYGRPLADTHMPSLLVEPLYHADGQIREEVYVYGSFLQSRMYQAGVSCSDCHDPHSARLKSGPEPSDVCSTCHLPDRFAATQHHRHPEDAVACVDCHMTSTTYMVVDPRRDHSFRIPRPDLSVATGSPNACNSCHDDRDAAWAAAALRDWYGKPFGDHFALALHAANSAQPLANDKLLQVINDPAAAGIVRATALSLYRGPLQRPHADSIQRSLRDADSLVRVGALRALAQLPAELAVQWAAELLDDPLRAVRLAAFDAASPGQAGLPAARQAAFDRARREFLATQMAIAERPEAHANIASSYAAGGDLAAAENAYLTALKLEPAAAGIRVNLADLYRQMGRDDAGEVVLRQGLELDAANASLRHSLGLLLARTERLQESLRQLGEASRLAPDQARFVYVYGIALNSAGRQSEAIAVISAAVEAFPGDFDIGWAQVTLLQDVGLRNDARRAAAALVERFPGNENALQLLRSFDAA